MGTFVNMDNCEESGEERWSVSARGGLPEEVNSAGELKSLMLMMKQNLKFCLGLPFRYQLC